MIPSIVRFPARRRVSVMMLAALVALPALAAAQDYPSKPITIVVPFPAGAAVDNLVRPVAAELQRLSEA